MAIKSTIGPLKRKKRQTQQLPGLPVKALSSKSRKLSIAQKSLVLDLLAQGRRPYEILNILKEEQGVAVTSACVAAYVRNNREEIIKRKRMLSEGMEVVHLRYRHARLQEHVRLHAILVRQLFSELCSDCLGQGLDGVDAKGKSILCKLCKGRKRVIVGGVNAYDLGDDYGITAVTLANSFPPDGCDLAIWDRIVVNLKEIGDLVGDTKIRIAIDPEEQERLARAQEREALAKQVAQMSPAEFTRLLMKLSGEKGPIIEVVQGKVI